MKIGIVGTSIEMSNDEKFDMMKAITSVLKGYDNETDIIISGGAKGVDTHAIKLAEGLGFKTKIYNPEINYWKDYKGKTGRKTRNLKIALECNELYCFSVSVHKLICYHHKIPEKHEKTAGCWTGIQVKLLSKPYQLIVIPKRQE